jgi:hypothetical protein
VLLPSKEGREEKKVLRDSVLQISFSWVGLQFAHADMTRTHQCVCTQVPSYMAWLGTNYFIYEFAKISEKYLPAMF